MSTTTRRAAFALIAGTFVTTVTILIVASTAPVRPTPSDATGLPVLPTSVPEGSPRFTDPGGLVLDMRRLTVESGWALVAEFGTDNAGGWKIAITDDAGMTWRDATPRALNRTTPSIDFLDANHGWVLEPVSVDPDHPTKPVKSELWRTVDGGRHWKQAALPVKAIFEAALSFVSPEDGWLVVVPDGDLKARPTISYVTRNAGRTWTKVGRIHTKFQFEWPPARPLLGLTPKDAVLAVHGGMATHDGGRTWRPIDLPRPDDIPATAMLDIRDVVAAGHDVLASVQYAWKSGSSYTFAGGYEFVSHDRGRAWSVAWTRVPDMTERALVVAVDAATIFRFPDYGASIPGAYSTTFSATHDAGQTWTAVSGALPFETHFDVESFADALHAWAVISPDAHCPPGMSCPYAGGLPGRLVTTTDGGRTWTTGARP